MNQEECFQLGTFTRKVGNDGRLLLSLETDQPEQYNKTESVFVELNKRLVPFFVSSFRVLPGNVAHLKLEDVDSTEQAELLLGADVFLPLTMLPLLSGTKFYYHEVIGFTIRDLTSGQSAGVISEIIENGPNDLFVTEIDGHQNYIPIAGDWIKDLDRDSKTITMQLPEGLLGLNK